MLIITSNFKFFKISTGFTIKPQFPVIKASQFRDCVVRVPVFDAFAHAAEAGKGRGMALRFFIVLSDGI